MSTTEAAKQFLLDKFRADEAEYEAYGDTFYGAWGRLSVHVNVLGIELLSALGPAFYGFPARRLCRWARREGWRADR